MAAVEVTAGIIIIGNEILSGRTQDSNLKHLAIELNEWGIRVKQAIVIPDIEATVISTLQAYSNAYDYVFTTGGIGPTHDDITAECVAKAFDEELIQHPEIASLIRSRPAEPEVMESRLLMARVPQSAGLIDNPTGGPQGFYIRNVYVMAGIPFVMQAMLSSLKDKLRGGARIHSRSVTAFLGESQISRTLGAIQSRFPSVDIGSYPFSKDGRYATNLVIRGTDESLLDQTLTEICQLIEAAGETPLDIEVG